MNTTKRRLSQNLTASANKLRLDSLNKILKIDRSKKHKKDALAKQVSRVVLSDLLKQQQQNASFGQRELPDFRMFLSSKENVEVFREFLKTQYCHENIDFYLACERYRNLDPERVGKEMIKFMANQIYNDYLHKDARRPINIDYNCLQNIIKQMKEPQLDLLCDAQAEIFELMRTDCYPRFCKTWQLDKEIANKILQERLVDSTPLSSKISQHNNSLLNNSIRTNNDTTLSSYVSNHISYVNSTMNTMSSSSSCSNSNSIGQAQRATIIKTKERYGQSATITSISSSAASSSLTTAATKFDCPPECPYYRLGLPCQQHNNSSAFVTKTSNNNKDQRDLIDRIDFRKMHHVPSLCERKREPPPPPLPPKPLEQATTTISPVINKKYCPYVGKVFDV